MPKVKKPKEDKAREDRIMNEIVVDACDEDERAMGWYSYLEEKLSFDQVLLCKCTAKRAISPLRVGDEVELTGLAPEDECQHEIFVVTRWEKDGLAVPLSQLKVLVADKKTREAIEDWHYWVKMGYEF